MTTRKRLCAIKGISEAKVDKIKVEAVLFVSFMVNLRAVLVVTKRLLEVVLSGGTIDNVCCFWCICIVLLQVLCTHMLHVPFHSSTGSICQACCKL